MKTASPIGRHEIEARASGVRSCWITTPTTADEAGHPPAPASPPRPPRPAPEGRRRARTIIREHRSTGRDRPPTRPARDRRRPRTPRASVPVLDRARWVRLIPSTVPRVMRHGWRPCISPTRACLRSSNSFPPSPNASSSSSLSERASEHRGLDLNPMIISSTGPTNLTPSAPTVSPSRPAPRPRPRPRPRLGRKGPSGLSRVLLPPSRPRGAPVAEIIPRNDGLTTTTTTTSFQAVEIHPRPNAYRTCLLRLSSLYVYMHPRMKRKTRECVDVV